MAFTGEGMKSFLPPARVLGEVSSAPETWDMSIFFLTEEFTQSAMIYDAQEWNAADVSDVAEVSDEQVDYAQIDYDILSTDFVPQRRLRLPSQAQASLSPFATRRCKRLPWTPEQSVVSHPAVAATSGTSRVTMPYLKEQ